MKKFEIVKKADEKRESSLPINEEEILINKTRPLRGLYCKFLIRLKEAENSISGLSKKDFLFFSDVYSKVCVNFSMSREEIREILFLLNDVGLIEFVKFRGIKLNYELKEVENVKLA